MPMLEVFTHNDAEVFVLNAALSRVARSVGIFQQDLLPGLYKIRVSRAGTLQERLVELGGDAQQHHIFIDQFSAIAPIGPMLEDAQRVEDLAREAIDRLAGRGPGLLVLAHQCIDDADARRPFRGARIFPWRATRVAVRLDELAPSTTAIDGELWAAVAVEANPEDGPFVLELRQGQQLARQAVLVASGWQTRVFLRAEKDNRPHPHVGTTRVRTAATFDVSIQMARPSADVVYTDHWAIVEVARSALERGRAIFTSERLVEELLYSKYENPIAGLTGLHLFLDAKALSDAGDTDYNLARGLERLGRSEQEIADEVLVNLTRLLHPDRAAAVQGRSGNDGRATQVLVYADPDWPESPDLTALRLRACRCKRQIVVPSPPMFRVSWDVLKANAARDGKVWIGRALWTGTGAAGSAGPYLAWARGRHSVKRTLQQISDQFGNRPGTDGILPGAETTTETVVSNAGTVLYDGVVDHPGLPDWKSLPNWRNMSTLEAIGAAEADSAARSEFAAGFGLPLSILQEAPDRIRKRRS